MSLALLLPAGLVALAALALPWLIHLARRSEHRPTPFAALRWLRAQPRPRQRLRVDEWPLLLLRLLLLALLAVAMAQPALQGWPDARPRVAVAPGIAPERARAALAAAGDDARGVWLAPGFPALDQPMPTPPSDQASLLRELDAQLPPGASLSVLVPRRWGLLDGQAPRLSRPVRWQVLDGQSPLPADAPPTPPSLQVYGDPGQQALRYLRALQAAWQPGVALVLRPANASAPAPAPHAVAIWSATTPVPAPLLQWAHQGGSLLLTSTGPVPAGTPLQPRWRDARGASVLDGSAYGHGQWLRLVRPLDPAAWPQLLEADFPEALLAALQLPPPPRQADAGGLRPGTGAAAPHPPARPLGAWLALAIALLFALERWLASAPRRARHA